MSDSTVYFSDNSEDPPKRGSNPVEIANSDDDYYDDDEVGESLNTSVLSSDFQQNYTLVGADILDLESEEENSVEAKSEAAAEGASADYVADHLKFESKDIKATSSAPTSPTTSKVKSKILFHQKEIERANSSGNLDVIPVRTTRSNLKIDKTKIKPLDECDSSLRTHVSKKKPKEKKPLTPYKPNIAKHFKQNQEIMADAEADKASYDYQNKIYEAIKKAIQERTDKAKTICVKESKTETDIENLELNHAELESQRSRLKIKNSKFQDALVKLKGNTQLENFEKLDESYADSEALTIHWLNKIQKEIKKFNKDNEIGNKQKMELPSFEGDYTEFNTFALAFETFCRGDGDSNKRYQLISALKGKAYEYVGDLINRNQPFQVIWDKLKDHFGDQKRLTDATISDFFETSPPGNNMSEIASHFVKIKNRASNITALGLTVEQLLTHYYLLQIPGQFRTELEQRLGPETPAKLEFAAVEKAVEAISRTNEYNKNHSSSFVGSVDDNITAAVGSTSNTKNQTKECEAASGSRTNSYRGGRDGNRGGRDNYRGGRDNYRGGRDNYRGFGGRGRGRGRGGFPYNPYKHADETCYICEKKGHLAFYCDQYGAEDMRRRLRELKRCDACMVKVENHPDTCPINKLCHRCGNTGHYLNTCGIESPHPGSYLSKSK